MRRHHGRGQSSPFANKAAAPISEVVSLIRNFDSDVNPSRPVRQSPLAASQIQGMPLDLIDRIRSFPLFQSTPDSFLAEVGLHLRPQLHSTNDYILTEGEDAKSMYWLVRGAVAVTSRDGESTYAELKPGAFFGEIGILMDRPRTATVVARMKCLLVVLKKEDLRKILPAYPEVEQAIRDEALERLTILEKKKRQAQSESYTSTGSARRGSKRTRDFISDEHDVNLVHANGANGVSKKRKSPSPSPNEISSALGNGLVYVRSLLKELPLFTSLPPDLLHFLGLNALPSTFPPFTDIIKQDSTGREIFFIVRGEVEVLDEKVFESTTPQKNYQRKVNRRPPHVKARLKEGHYFGEVVSLSLAPRRTATVRSVTSVECLMITAEVLAAFWDRCPAGVRQQIEQTARERLKSASANDVIMDDTGSAPAMNQLAIGEQPVPLPPKMQPAPKVTFNDAEIGSPHRFVKPDDQPVLGPSDPDPFLSVGFDKVKSRSRRGSLAPISPDDIEADGRNKSTSPTTSRSETPSPLESRCSTPFSDPFSKLRSRAPTPPPRSTGPRARGYLPDHILVNVFKHLKLHELFRLRAVSLHWSGILTRSPELFQSLDLTPYNRKLTDEVLSKYICPFVGERPRLINISNCFHITDEGFNSLASICGANVKTWKMKSVWDVTAPAILDMANKAKGLQEVDLSNCRKVSDTLLARILGWVVPATPPARHPNGRPSLVTRNTPQSPNQPPPGTVFGCPYLKRLTLSYCKHVTDRTMHHIASHASTRIEQMDLTRCTTITDTGFQYWGNAQFLRLRKLCLADCTYLTDNAIIYLTNAAKGLQELDLVSQSSCPAWLRD
jgi:F-box and leucine-rich repeat protein 7